MDIDGLGAGDIVEPCLSQEEHVRRNHLLRCMVDYLYSLEGREETEYSEEMVNWMQMMEKLRTEPTEDPLKADLVCHTNPAVGASRQLLALLRDALLNQRWRTAGRVLLNLMMEPMCPVNVIWRANCEIMWQLRDDLRGEFERFFKQMWELRALPKEVMAMENLFFLLSNNQTREAKDAMMSHEIKSSDKSSKNVSQLFRAYKGLFAYWEWRQLRKERDEAVDDAERVVLGHKIDAKRRRVIQYFDSLMETKLVTEMFVVRHVEILEEEEETEKALRLLESYATTHPDSPNAYLYLYDFCQRHLDRFSEEQVDKVLRQIVKLNPTSPLLLTLVDKCDINAKGTLLLLMTSLDYDHWRYEERLWEKLSLALQYLTKTWHDTIFYSSRDVIMKELRSLWEPRQSWWPFFHFVTDEIRSRGEILGYMTVVACLLCGTGSPHAAALLTLEQSTETMWIIRDYQRSHGHCDILNT